MPRREDPAETTIRAIGQRIAQLRRERSLTQEQFAEVVGVSEKYVQRVEAGANLSVRSLVKFADALGVTLVSLLRAPRRDRSR